MDTGRAPGVLVMFMSNCCGGGIRSMAEPEQCVWQLAMGDEKWV